jgi:hypothetical protein
MKKNLKLQNYKKLLIIETKNNHKKKFFSVN